MIRWNQLRLFCLGFLTGLAIVAFVRVLLLPSAKPNAPEAPDPTPLSLALYPHYH